MPIPKSILVAESKDMLVMKYGENQQHQLPAEYLRVFSPSAEVRGHGTVSYTHLTLPTKRIV